MRLPFLMTRQRRWLTPLLLALGGGAQAHDTWFAQLPTGPKGEVVLSLGTGEQFPKQQTPLDKDLIKASACQGMGPTRQPAAKPLQWVAYRPDAVLLRSALPAQADTRQSCWMQAQPLAIDLDDAIVNLYLDEIRALPTVRERWASLKARGVRWQERYVKHARIELPAATPSAATAGQAGQASGAGSPAAAPGLDLQADMPAGPLRVGDTLRVQLLRDGKPLAGLPVVLRNDLSPLALWHRSDADGWVNALLPLAARWLVSAVDLRPSDTQPDGWDSRFISLSVEALPRR